MSDSILRRLPPDLRPVAERIAAEHGLPALERLARAIAAAGKRGSHAGRGRPARDDAALLRDMAALLAANPAWRAHRAASEVVARRGSTRVPRIAPESLKRKLLRDWVQRGADLLREARAARAAQGRAGATTVAVRPLSAVEGIVRELASAHEAHKLLEAAGMGFPPSLTAHGIFLERWMREHERMEPVMREMERIERMLRDHERAERALRAANAARGL